MKALIFVVLLIASAFAQLPNWEDVEQSLGPGKYVDGVLVYNLIRSDITNFTVGEYSLDPSFAAGVLTWQDLSMGMPTNVTNTTGGNVLCTGFMPILEPEIDITLMAMKSVNITITAVVTHFVMETPRMMFVHFYVMGSRSTLISGFSQILEGFGNPQRTMNSTGLATWDPTNVISNLNGEPSFFNDKVLVITIPRNDMFTLDEITLVAPPEGYASTFMFQDLLVPGEEPINATTTNTTTPAMNMTVFCYCEIPVLVEEAQAVMTALEDGGFTISAFHNHYYYMEPMLFYIHAMHTGDPDTLSRTLLEVLRNTNSGMM